MVELQVVHEPGDRWRENRTDVVTSSVETEPGGCLQGLAEFWVTDGTDRRVESDMDATFESLAVAERQVVEFRVTMHAYEETWAVGEERKTRGTDLSGCTFVVNRDTEELVGVEGTLSEDQGEILERRFLEDGEAQVEASLTEPHSVEEGLTFQAPEWIERFRTDLRRIVTESETDEEVPVHSLHHRKGDVRYCVSDVTEQMVTLQLEGDPVYEVTYTAQGNRMRQEMVMTLAGTVRVDCDHRKVVRENRTVERDTFYYTGNRLLARGKQTTTAKVTRDLSPPCSDDSTEGDT